MTIQYLGKMISDHQWNDWKWQMRNRVVSIKQVAELGLPPQLLSEAEWPISITPHQVRNILELAELDRFQLLRTLLPSRSESEISVPVGEAKEGLGTGFRKKVFGEAPSVIRRLYSDRAILTPSLVCSCNCRYCFRRNEVGCAVTGMQIQEGIAYIRTWNISHPDCPIRDVILSGGDPLVLSDNRLNSILEQVHSIPGVEIVRLDTKFAASLPQRFTVELQNILERYVTLLCLDFCHPGEISRETVEACRALAKRGIILRAYIPLLRGVNDSRDILKQLFWKLLSECKVTPYYLVHCIETPGANHFKVPLEDGIEIMDRLQVELSGVALPKYICYLPNGGGKVELGKQTFYSRTEEGYWLRSPITGEPALYPDRA